MNGNQLSLTIKQKNVRKMKKIMTKQMTYLGIALAILFIGTASTRAADFPLLTAGQDAAALQSLSPAQQAAITEELIKTGGTLTPEAMEALQGRPEFQGLSPQDIVKGKEMLGNQEAAKNNALKKEMEKARLLDTKDIKGAESKNLLLLEPEKTLSPFEEKGQPAEGIRTILGEGQPGKSLYERSREIRKYQDIALDLKPFGYDFFREAAVKVSTGRRDIPVPMKYVVGPGDEVRMVLWGRMNASYTLTVDRDGKINIPAIGPLVVAGMTFEQMSQYLIKQAEQITGTNVDVSMGSLRTIPIFVLGDVRRPGAYTIGSFATMIDALLLAGGPTEIGSMRNIQLKRKDRLVQTFDIYDLLLKGDKSYDVMLYAGDVVFVPIIGPYVGVAGNVKRPALYELKNDFSLAHVFELAGGIIPTAYTQQIQVERTVKNEKKVIVDLDDKNLAKAKSTVLQEADLVKVFSIVEKDVNVVTLQGNVKRGGKYALRTGMRLADVLKDTQADLLPETYFDYALIKRQTPPRMEPELIPFNLGDLMLKKDPASNLELQPLDSIYIFSKWFFRDKQFFKIEGEIRKPGRYDLTQNFKIKDALLAAGGLTRDAHLSKAEIIRVNKQKEYQTLYFDVTKALAEDSADNLLLCDEDRIVIHSVWEEVYKKEAAILGEVKTPGTYQLTDNMTIKDLIFKAGNTLESAFLEEAELSSQRIVENDRADSVYRKINLAKALAGDPEHNLVLQPYDRLFIRRMPNWLTDKYVTVAGEVRFPGRYLIKKGERLSALLERAGGYRDTAYLRGAYFTRERVRELQQQSLIEMADRLERELLGASAGQLSTALSTEEVEGKKVELAQKQKFIDSLRKLKATGRMTIYLSNSLRLLKGKEYDIELEEGDSLLIPQKNSVVNVAGAVMSQGTYLYSHKLDYNDYINQTGGYASFADKKNVFVMKVDGSARKLATGFFDFNSSHGTTTQFGERIKNIEPGDTIVVPEKTERIAWLREIRDITQILMNTAVAAGVAINLF